MPNPHRLVRKSVLLLQRMGMAEADALDMVEEVARTVRFRVYFSNRDEGGWLSQVIRAVDDWRGTLTPSSTDSMEEDNGDGRRS